MTDSPEISSCLLFKWYQSDNDLAPAVFTFVRICLKIWKSRFFQFLQTWDASIQMLFDSPDGAVKSGNHSSQFHIHRNFYSAFIAQRIFVERALGFCVHSLAEGRITSFA